MSKFNVIGIQRIKRAYGFAYKVRFESLNYTYDKTFRDLRQAILARIKLETKFNVYIVTPKSARAYWFREILKKSFEIDVYDQKFLRRVFTYNEEEGALYWKVNFQFNQPCCGKRAGSDNIYRDIQLFGKNRREHILIWAYHYGKPSFMIDHKDQNPLNNKIENLRPSDPSSNAKNKRASRKSKTGINGVSPRKIKDKTFYCAGIASSCKGKIITTKKYKTLEDAVLMRFSLELEYNYIQYNKNSDAIQWLRNNNVIDVDRVLQAYE